jgi:hypothetical protein
MESQDEGFRDRLLAHQAPAPDQLLKHRKEMQTMLERNERGLRREKWVTGILWLYAVAFTTAFLMVSGMWHTTPERVWFSMLAMVGFIDLFGAIEIVKLFVNRSRVEVLKEVKQLEMQVLELQELLRGRTTPPS